MLIIMGHIYLRLLHKRTFVWVGCLISLHQPSFQTALKQFCWYLTTERSSQRRKTVSFRKITHQYGEFCEMIADWKERQHVWLAYNLWNSFDLPINNFVTKTFGIPFTWPINLMIMLRDTEKGELVGTRTRQGKGENSEPTEGRRLFMNWSVSFAM